jgi:hypothetical protein
MVLRKRNSTNNRCTEVRQDATNHNDAFKMEW